MINLLPPSARKQIKLEYWTRVLTVWMVMISCGLFIIAALTFPTKVLLLALSSTLSSEMGKVKDQQQVFKELDNEVAQINALIKHLDTSKEPNFLSNLIYELDTLALPDVKLTQFNVVESVDGVVESVNLVGFADTRTGLSEFRDRLEASVHFEAVLLPISNLTKDKDITFSLTVNLEKP